MSEQLDDIRSRLETISEELADLALVHLREAVDAGEDGAGAAATERRLTRARRSIDKAAAVLGGDTS
ncbi:MAG TPA: hypothetical protein VM121_10510 [Acidimicrobiales bacterium]|nr:hypothetical protein [Acidimicrobiales bacterium]